MLIFLGSSCLPGTAQSEGLTLFAQHKVTMRAIVAFLVLLSLVASTRVTTDLSPKHTESPPGNESADEDGEDAEVEKWSAADTIPEDLKSGVLLADFQKKPCCTCSLSFHSVMPKWVNKLRWKAGAKCEYGGSETRFCGPTCDGPLHNHVCWKREYRQDTKNKDRGLWKVSWACWAVVWFCSEGIDSY